ncbi:acyl carrier protein [Streptomyces alanosinicus]|uniref:Actinorhodin polyketide synthase acyl carrier protein n=1 Tax=Streptomyces alanosinicus TaxID=68171 RepID=A0A919D8K3_9ACTN|nr:acyl carrier protein [Streptomyces alanosinicus]GHE13582.1 actinorhodin polyketide synthase acyl carrier protein [Streptomyces alanosinicus]
MNFSLDGLRTILRACAGEPENGDLDGEVAAITFEDLGYDSIALLETLSRIEQEYGVAVDEAPMDELTTPQALVDYVNSRLARETAHV